jgi:hypothetical protein
MERSEKSALHYSEKELEVTSSSVVYCLWLESQHRYVRCYIERHKVCVCDHISKIFAA